MLKASGNFGLGSMIQKILYRLLLPAATAAALFYASPHIARPWLSGSASLDFAARLWLWGGLTAQFIILSDWKWIRKWLFLQVDHEDKDDLANVVWDMFRIGLFFLLPTIIVYLSIEAFLPSILDCELPIAAAYGALNAVPVALVLRGGRLSSTAHSQ
jgi:hypothetical protein